jgi:hypothetical protein
VPARHKRHGSRFVKTNHAHLLLFLALERRFGLRLLLLLRGQPLVQRLRFGVFQPLLRLVLLRKQRQRIRLAIASRDTRERSTSQTVIEQCRAAHRRSRSHSPFGVELV